jgi:putative ABC transport system substrate-binding protein
VRPRAQLSQDFKRKRAIPTGTAKTKDEHVRRREFTTLLGAAMTCSMGPSAVVAQGKMHKIGFLALGNPDPAPFVKGVQQGLRDLGYVESQNVAFELRSAEGKADRLAPLAAELVALKVDLIVAFQTPAGTAAKRATNEIPIVANVGDPVGTGLVASLSRPGGNITGVSGAAAELGAKQLELIREILPDAKRVGVLINAPDPFSRTLLAHIEEAAKVMNIELATFMLRGADGLETAFDEMVKSRVSAVVMQPSLPHEVTAQLALKARLPSFSPNPLFPGSGGLLAYAADYDALYRDTATLIDKVLKGRNPAELPFQLPSKFWLAINLKTAKAIGVTVPGTMLTRADQVIE